MQRAIMLLSPLIREEFSSRKENSLFDQAEPMETDSDEPELFDNHFSSSSSDEAAQNNGSNNDSSTGDHHNVFPFQDLSTPEMELECPEFKAPLCEMNKMQIASNIGLPKITPSMTSKVCMDSNPRVDLNTRTDDDDDIGFGLFDDSDDDTPSLSSRDCDVIVTQSKPKVEVELQNSGSNLSILDEIMKNSVSQSSMGNTFISASAGLNSDSQLGIGNPSASARASAGQNSEDDFCCICRDEHTDPVILPKCSHKYCRECIDQYFKIKPVCPECFVPYGIITGNQPDGTMNHSVNKKTRLQGQDKPGAIVIHYYFSDGTQNENHPKPGKPYYGTSRTAYLPDTPEGHKVLKLLSAAFDRRLVFTVGRSRTTGADDVVTWNDIHHKTSTAGGHENFGYPDPTYLRRVSEELAAVGVTEESLAAK